MAAVDLPEPPATSAPERPLPRIAGVLGHYNGPTSDEGMERRARLLATARHTIHPAYRGSPGDCLLLLERAAALDIPVGIAVDHVYINFNTGKAGLTAQLMTWLLHRGGVRWIVVRETDQVVEFWFYWTAASVQRLERWQRAHRGPRPAPDGKSEWTILEAVGLGLTRNILWQQVPQDCLWARALARGCRHYFSGLTGGQAYTIDETHQMTLADALPVEETPLDPQVQGILDAAANAETNAEHIQKVLIPRAKKAKLLDYELPDGRTLQQALQEVWLVAAGRDRAAQADTAVTPLRTDPGAVPTETPVPAVLDAPAGEGTLPCGCPATILISGTGHVPGVCTGVLTSVG